MEQDLAHRPRRDRLQHAVADQLVGELGAVLLRQRPPDVLRPFPGDPHRTTSTSGRPSVTPGIARHRRARPREVVVQRRRCSSWSRSSAVETTCSNVLRSLISVPLTWQFVAGEARIMTKMASQGIPVLNLL